MGCKGNHDSLAATGGAGSTSSSATSSSVASSSSASTSTGNSNLEPEIATQFTFVNGAVDQATQRYCFVPYPDGAQDRPPFPAAGVAFGTSARVLGGVADIPTSDALIVAIAGDTGAATCTQLVAHPENFPSVVVTELGVVPASALTAKKSLLVVTYGCFEAGHDDMNNALICGPAYATDTPNPGLAFLPMSLRDDTKHIAFQYINAVASVPKANAWVTPSFSGATPIAIVSGAPLGASAPYPPLRTLDVSKLGGVSGTSLGSAVNPSPTPAATVALSDALANGGLEASHVANGNKIALVAVGATPGTTPAPDPGAWWHAFTIVALDPGP